MFPGHVPGQGDQSRIILQSSDGSSRLMEASPLRQCAAIALPEGVQHVTTTLWVAPADKENINPRSLRCHSAQVPMVEEYSNRLEKALEHHNQEVYSFLLECNNLTGAITCGILPIAAAVNPIERAKLGIVHIPSTLINEETRPDPAIEAHIEPQDRSAGAALQEVPDGLSDAPTNVREAARRPDWALWKAACMEKMMPWKRARLLCSAFHLMTLKLCNL